ncbi:MAG TPA: tRNA (adenosine(37)-N6)-threonylcarbamoyltransferase complex dimerization subunit type 1 TsaB [Patescibacteria group bacterium]|nr:tRNA (adenosine(37)-N6)-threonylcarbamoyltransferase complex dimerization subunit type 1 TsaB [Patescibacteria group bacterium]
MKLFIDTTDREKIIIGLDDKKFETNARENSSQKLLPFIEETLKKEKKDIKDISEITVATGPGSFTGIRVGVAVANTLAYVLKIPVNKKALELDINY